MQIFTSRSTDDFGNSAFVFPQSWNPTSATAGGGSLTAEGWNAAWIEEMLQAC